MIEDLLLNPAWTDPPSDTRPDRTRPDRTRSDSRTAPEAAESIDLPALVAAHASLLFRVAHAVLRNRAEAEDTVQDTFVRVLQHQRDLPSIRDLRPWLVRICWRLALDRRRRLRPDQLDDLFAASLVSPGLSPEAALAETRRLAATLHEIDRLPRAEREILLLSALNETGPAGLDHADLAATLGKSPSATRALLFRARTRLRDRLAHKGLQ